MFKFKVNKNIYLKLFNEKEAETLFNLIESNRDHLNRWLTWLDEISVVSDSRDFIKNSREQFANNNGFQVGIWYNKKLVGVIALHYIDFTNKKTSIGYWIGQEYEGKGIITKCCQSLVEYVFNELDLNKVEISCAEGNVKSRSIPERLGFVQEGVIRDCQWLNDKFVDHIKYGILKEEWE